MIRPTIKLEGLKGVEDALFRVKGSTAKNKVRKVLREAGEPVARRMRRLAPEDEGDLSESIDVSPTLTRPQRRIFRKGYLADVEMHIGPSGLVQGITSEFGTINQMADPFARPAWYGMEIETLDLIGAGLWVEVSKKARGKGRR
ncbi:MAG: HK97-gp10 family putative phage morphogenesis protein [Pseudomonadota bacterium]